MLTVLYSGANQLDSENVPFFFILVYWMAGAADIGALRILRGAVECTATFRVRPHHLFCASDFLLTARVKSRLSVIIRDVRVAIFGMTNLQISSVRSQLESGLLNTPLVDQK